jgi:Protein of unknown function (DUF3309)
VSSHGEVSEGEKSGNTFLAGTVIRVADLRDQKCEGFTFQRFREESAMTLGTILVIVLILLLLGVIPNWGYSSGWGYGPSGIVGTILIVVLILLLLGRI